MKLPETTKGKKNNNINGEVTEAVLVHCNIVNNDYQQDLGILCTFIPNKLFGQLLDISIFKNNLFRIFIY